MYEGDRRFDMVVRLSDAMRKDLEELATLLIPVPALLNGSADQIAFIALSEVATLDLVLGPNQVSRENGKRLVIVSANVRGRDIGSFVQEASTAIDQQVQTSRLLDKLGWAVRATQSAAKRLQIVVPVALLWYSPYCS